MRKAVGFVLGILAVAAIAAGGYFLTFPLRFKRELSAAARAYDLPPALVAALVKTESGYDPAALSSRGAVGLMQMMPATAAWQAAKIGLDRYVLTDPADNLRLGCAYLAYLRTRYGGDLTETLAAYNAGPSRVDEWKSDERYSDKGRLTEIPFRETSRYVRKVLRAEKWYRVRF